MGGSYSVTANQRGRWAARQPFHTCPRPLGALGSAWARGRCHGSRADTGRHRAGMVTERTAFPFPGHPQGALPRLVAG